MIYEILKIHNIVLIYNLYNFINETFLIRIGILISIWNFNL